MQTCGVRGADITKLADQVLPVLLLPPASHAPGPPLPACLMPLTTPGGIRTGGLHLQDFVGKTSTASVPAKPNSMVAMLTAGSGAGALRLSARLAASPLHPRQTVLASVVFQMKGSRVLVRLDQNGTSHRLVATVHGAKSTGKLARLTWPGAKTHSLKLAGPLQLRLLSPRRLAIQMPQLTVTVSQVCWEGGNGLQLLPCVAVSGCPAPVCGWACGRQCPTLPAPMAHPPLPVQEVRQTRFAGYLNLALTAYPGLPAPLGGLLGASYHTAAPALAAHAKAIGSSRPSVTATITSVP